jgi:hypothetical protein
VSEETTPPSRRVARFTDRLRGNPLGEPSGGRSLGSLASRTVIVAGLAIVGWFLFWSVARTCACTPRPSFPDSPVEGVVVSVSSPSLGQVTSFDLRLASGGTLHFFVGTLENATEFPPSHLAEHQATSQPVRVHFRTENGIHTVYRLEDAAPSGL